MESAIRENSCEYGRTDYGGDHDWPEFSRAKVRMHTVFGRRLESPILVHWPGPNCLESADRRQHRRISSLVPRIALNGWPLNAKHAHDATWAVRESVHQARGGKPELLRDGCLGRPAAWHSHCTFEQRITHDD